MQLISLRSEPSLIRRKRKQKLVLLLLVQRIPVLVQIRKYCLGCLRSLLRSQTKVLDQGCIFLKVLWKPMGARYGLRTMLTVTEPLLCLVCQSIRTSYEYFPCSYICSSYRYQKQFILLEIKRRITNIALIGLVDIFNCSYASSEIQNKYRPFPPNDYRVSKRRFTALSNIFLLNALNE